MRNGFTKREAFEECGLHIEPDRMLYIEEFVQPGKRHCKVWFAARLVRGTLNCGAPEARSEHIVEAARRVVAAQPYVHFLVMGYPGSESYRCRAEELGVGDHLTFTGRVPYDQAARYLRVGDIALAPKLSLTEGAGKILNYMACALPTVAFDTPQAREFMAHFGVYAERGSAVHGRSDSGAGAESGPRARAGPVVAGARHQALQLG